MTIGIVVFGESKESITLPLSIILPFFEYFVHHWRISKVSMYCLFEGLICAFMGCQEEVDSAIAGFVWSFGHLLVGDEVGWKRLKKVSWGFEQTSVAIWVTIYQLTTVIVEFLVLKGQTDWLDAHKYEWTSRSIRRFLVFQGTILGIRDAPRGCGLRWWSKVTISVSNRLDLSCSWST